MTVRVGNKVLTVTVGGQDVSAAVRRVRTHVGFDVRVNTAEVELLDVVEGISTWQEVTIDAGLTGTGRVGSRRRFTGFVTPTLEAQVWPYTTTLHCRGHLALAEVTPAPEDADDPTVEDTLSVSGTGDWLAPGFELSPDKDGATYPDAAIVTTILERCGLSAYLGEILGTGRIFGNAAPESFIWRRNQKGLDVISALDEVCLGYRTYEDEEGLIHRTLVSPRVPFVDDRVELFENREILKGASLQRQTEHLANRVIVQGFDDGTGPVVYACPVAPLEPMPPGNPVITRQLTSPMVEWDTDTGSELTVQLVAAWLADEVSEVKLEGQIPTWSDAVYTPGHTAYLNSPRLLDVLQSLWIRSVEMTVGIGEPYRQTVGLFGRLYREGRAPRLGSMRTPNPLSPRRR